VSNFKVGHSLIKNHAVNILKKLSGLQFSFDQLAQIILSGLRKEAKNIAVYNVDGSSSLEVLKKKYSQSLDFYQD